MAYAALALAGCAALDFSKPAPIAAVDPVDSATTRTFLELAAIREDQADWNGALDKIDKALARQPRSRTALLRRAQIELLASDASGDAVDPSEAHALLLEIGEGDDADRRLAQAWLDTVEQRHDAALAGARQVAGSAADDARAQWMAARLLVRLGDRSAALDAAKRAFERDPRSHAAQRERARAHLRMGDMENAIGDLGTQLRAHPADLESRALEGDVMWRLGSHGSARHAYEQIPPERRNGAVWAAIGRLALLEKDLTAARSALEAGVAAHPTDPQVLAALLALDQRERRVGDSLARLAAAAAARPGDAAIARVRGSALAAGQQPDDAAAAFATALRLDPNDAATYEAIALWLAKVAPAESERRIAALGAAPAPARVARASVLAARGDRAGAIAAAQQALDADPALPAAKSALARALADDGQQLDRALTLAREARAARPTDLDVAWTLGIAHLRRGQGESAFEVLRECLGSYPIERPGYGEQLYQGARALDDMGERATASRVARIALAHAEVTEPAPAWASGAKSLRARLDEPAPKPAAATAASPAADAATPSTATATDTASPTPAAATPPAPAPQAAPPAAPAAPVEAAPKAP